MVGTFFSFLFLLISTVMTLNNNTAIDYKNPIGKVIETPTNIPSLYKTPTLTQAPTFTPTPIPTSPTPIITVTTSSTNLEELFGKYASQYNVSKDLLKKIAGCESGFNPNAVNNDYAGLFQFASFAWREARSRLGADDNLDLRFNPEESIRTAAHEISYKGTSGWSDCDK